jgi:phytoene desaturase
MMKNHKEMTGKRNVVIIGAGIGGITTAVYLAKRGFDVTVFEKNASPGGRCGQLLKKGHRFDLGATMLLMPGIYREIFNSLGIDLEEGSGIVPLKDLYDIYFDDGTNLAFTTDTERMRHQLEKIEAGSFKESERYVSEGYKIYQIGIERLVSRNFYTLPDFASLRNISLLFKLKIFISNWRYAKKFFRHPHLLMAYTFQNIYVGQGPFDSPALFSMVPAAELTEGSLFPVGGMFAIVEKLQGAAIRAGVKFRFNTPVREIKISEKKAQGVYLADGAFTSADIIVANADLPYVYRDMLPDRKKSARLDRLNYSCSAICFHWGLDKVYPELGHHSVFLSDQYKEGLRRILIDKTVNDRPSFYVHAPARTDKRAAPAGHDTISVVVGAGHVDKKKRQDWSMIREGVRSSVIDRLKRFGLEDIEDHIKFEICHTPEDWQTAINISRGSVFGSVGHDILQMGYFRPRNRHDRYHNLYFVGGSTHPGNGIPNVLISARLVTERIIKETIPDNK